MKINKLFPTGASQFSLKNYSKINGNVFFKRNTLYAAILAASSVAVNNTYAVDTVIANGNTEATTQILNADDSLIIDTGGAIDIAVSGNNGVTGSGANITIDSNGSITTDSANGISVVGAEDADITIGSGGTIIALGSNAFGVVVGVDSEGAGITTAGTISTIGLDSVGVLVDSGVTVSIEGFGTISTQGVDSHGIATFSGNNMITLGEDALITTFGNNAHGIASDANNYIDSNGSISTLGADAVGISVNTGPVIGAGGNSSTVLNSGGITTEGGDAHGIEFLTSDGTVTNSGSIFTEGVTAYGMLLAGPRGTYANDGEITTEGDGSVGINIFAGMETSTLINSGGITTDGVAAHGIEFVAQDGAVTSSGSISTEGQSAYGMFLTGLNGTFTNGGEIITGGDFSHGIFSFLDGGVITNDGAISTSGSSSNGVALLGPSTTITNTSTIDVTGVGSAGISSQGLQNTIVNSGTITTTAVDAVGILAIGDDVSILNSGSISTTSDLARAIYSLSPNSNIDNSGSISVNGDGTYGIFSGGDNTEILHSGTIEVVATDGIGIFSGSTNNTTITVTDSGSIEVRGSDGIGIASINGNNTITVSGSVLATDGATRAIIGGPGALGVDTVNLLSGAKITGNINLRNGDDFLVLHNDVTINGDIDLGGDIDTVIFDQSGDGDFSNNIANAESVFKINTGTLTLDGDNVYGNATATINQGTVVVNGSTSDSITIVNAEGVLSGGGTVGAVRVNSGTFAPGNSIGTTTVSGNLQFNNGGVYVAEVDAAGNSDLIDVAGTATLTSGAVIIEPGADNYGVGTDYEYTILTAAGGLLDTTFDTVTSTLAFLTPTVSYDNNNVYLTLVRDVDFESVAATPTQLGVATALTNALENDVDALNGVSSEIVVLTSEGAQQAFDGLSGIQHTYNQLLIHRNSQQFGNILSNRSQHPFNILPTSASFYGNSGLLLAYNREPSALGASTASAASIDSFQRGWWIQGFGGNGEVDGNSNVDTADYGTTGLVFGIDTDISNGIIGIAASFANTDVEAFNSNLDIETHQLAIYGQWQQADFYIDGSIRYGMNATNTRRGTVIGTLNEVARSSFDTNTLSMSIEGGKPIDLNEATTIKPYVGLEYSNLSQDGFTETDGSSTNLSVDSEDSDNTRVSFGARLYRDLTTQKGLQLTPYVDLAYVRDDANVFTIDASFTVVPQGPFTAESAGLDKSRVRLSLGVMGYATDRTTFNIGYTGEFASSGNHGTIEAMARFRW